MIRELTILFILSLSGLSYAENNEDYAQAILNEKTIIIFKIYEDKEIKDEILASSKFLIKPIISKAHVYQDGYYILIQSRNEDNIFTPYGGHARVVDSLDEKLNLEKTLGENFSEISLNKLILILKSQNATGTLK